jgi:amidase
VEVYDGAPAGVQMFGRRLQEEKLLVLAEYVSAAVAGAGA